MNARVSPDIAGTSVDHLVAVACGNVNPDRSHIVVARPGRPAGADPCSERTRKPWIAAGISKRTFYRRKAHAAAMAPKHHSAHVAAWFAQLGPIARLEHRAFMRRCLLQSFRSTFR